PRPLSIHAEPMPGTRLPFEVYHAQGSYYVKNNRGAWYKINLMDLQRKLKSFGYDSKIDKKEGGLLSHQDRAILAIQDQCTIDTVGPLAGYSAGLVEVKHNLHLVTSSAPPLKAELGPWPTLERFFRALLDDEQRTYFFSWLHVARKNVLTPTTWMAGQMVVLAGAAGTGKTLCQERVITPLLGGSADPFQYITGLTSFNSDLIAAPHLSMGDPPLQPDNRTKRMFGSNLKNMAVNSEQRFHGKGQNAVSVYPKWRISLSCNMEASEFAGLPNLDDSVKEKLMLFKVMPGGVPANVANDDFNDAITAELPAFAHYIDNWRVPEELYERRFQVKSYLHPDLEKLIRAHDPAERFWVALQSELFYGGAKLTEWEGTEHDLRVHLQQAEILFTRFTGSESLLPDYLTRLSKVHEKYLYVVHETKTTRTWHIKKEE
ncbi:MAG: hypothetical protein ACO395_09980, partial [Pontimonas sp.]